MRRGWMMIALAALCAAGPGCSQPKATPPAALTPDQSVPRYAHIFVILEENKDYEQLLDPAAAPNFAALAQAYGSADRFYGEVHPSEGNYVALLGGDTFGIHDDDAFYCKPAQADPNCPHANEPGYLDHTAHAPHIGDQLTQAGLTWKAYLEDLPAPGSLIANAKSPTGKGGDTPQTALYASKHVGFVNFASVQSDPNRAEHLVDFKAFDADLASGALPAFGLIVPNQCNEMHGLAIDNPPAGCDPKNPLALIRRGDKEIGDLVKKIQATAAWGSKDNVAIVITFDEGGSKTREGCCAVTPDAASNFGGGHIPTVVITNHGPHGVTDITPYNHYSLLRTIEDAFGLSQHLGHAADLSQGVTPMVQLFATAPATGQ